MNEKKVAELLLKIGAVTLRPEDPFTWSSGIKSPIYCDNRLIMSYPEERKQFIDYFVSYIKEKFPQVEVLAATATAGIPHAAWIADRLNIPMIYVRSSSKGHGKQNRIEGTFQAGKKILVIEDLISTGGSSIEAANSVKDVGGDVIGISAIFTYELPDAKKSAEQLDYPLASLTTYTSLIDVASKQGTISNSQLELLHKWRENPKDWLL